MTDIKSPDPRPADARPKPSDIAERKNTGAVDKLKDLRNEAREATADLVDRRDVVPADTRDEDRKVYGSVAEHDAAVTGSIPNDRHENPLQTAPSDRAAWEDFNKAQQGWTVQQTGKDSGWVDPSFVPTQDYVNDPPAPTSVI